MTRRSGVRPPAPLPEAQIRVPDLQERPTKILDQANGTRPVHGESQDYISVYEVTAAPGG